MNLSEYDNPCNVTEKAGTHAMDHMAVSEALDHLRRATHPIGEVEQVPLTRILGRTLAEDLRAPLALPSFDRAAMDGYAIRAEEAPGDLILVGSIAAGQDPKHARCQPGQAIRILTGAPIPDGADAVVEQEQIQSADGRIQVPMRIRKGRNISRRGSELDQGDFLLGSGQRIGPTELALIAAMGQPRLNMFRKPHILLLTTGDELTLPGEPLAPSDIYDTNRFLLGAVLHTASARVTTLPIVGDEGGLFLSTLQKSLAADSFDFVITSGGVSVGDRDDVIHALSSEADLLFWRVDMHPGKSVAGARVEGTPLLALSGNPGAAMTSWLILGAPLLAHLNHGVLYQEKIQGRLASDFDKPTRETRYLRVHTKSSAHGLEFDWNLAQQSDVLSSFRRADAFAIIPGKSPPLQSGTLLNGLRTGGMGPTAITWNSPTGDRLG